MTDKKVITVPDIFPTIFSDQDPNPFATDPHQGGIANFSEEHAPGTGEHFPAGSGGVEDSLEMSPGEDDDVAVPGQQPSREEEAISDPDEIFPIEVLDETYQPITGARFIVRVDQGEEKKKKTDQSGIMKVRTPEKEIAISQV